VSASASRPVHGPERFSRLWWLPARGQGNGLSDQAWAPVADVDAAIVADLLAELRTAGVPAYAAPATGRRGRSRGRTYHVWVGTSAYSRAEDTLRVKLPELVRRAPS
jgi:hypothetical protein